MHWTEIVSLVTLGFGALIGFISLINPAWGANVVRLQADPDPLKPGGFSEFRATYGGLFLMLHLMALLLTYHVPRIASDILILAPIAAGWIGAGLGRTVSLLFDREENREAGLIPIWIPLEILIGLAIFAPFLQLMGKAQGI